MTAQGMTIYEPFTLGRLIKNLRDLPPDTEVRGLDGMVHSYRGWYERNATTPTGLVRTAAELADFYQSEIGETMGGWKGGDYIISADELIYYADYGDSGPLIIGLEPVDHGGFMRSAFSPVLLTDPHYLL
ncbi:hypothetical protein PBI_CLUBL_112 [Gordonia phage ClubL]|uniref:Uncharacterized protein n=1 Tax=Gordonia phage ClubL TaxID=1838065 RepID=A0A160DF63_9CAUD|nr:hypothetical protein BH768_gp095 [Gordonia phage ClubL]ANA86610.1 hypothetical protein PBI_CLUBL_112 [Gordonia phage ClubL]